MANKISIVEDVFGHMPAGTENEGPSDIIRRFTLSSTSGLSVQVITYGAAITSIKVPNRNGEIVDIVLGFEDIAGYLGEYGENPYFGALVGRVANRTAYGRFTLGDREYQLTLNDGQHHLHGGINGFDKRNWDAHIDGTKLICSYISVDGEEGYPGGTLCQVSFELTVENYLVMEYQALTTQPTPINLANHTYFNITGHQNADKRLAGHHILIDADEYTPVDEGLITTGEILPVAGTKFDLRQRTDLHQLLVDNPEGFDHNFCINVGEQTHRRAVRVEDSVGGRVMEIYTDQPGLQFYTGNFLSNEDPIIGKDGARYLKNGAICLETQNYPNSINLANFPDSVVNPGEMYRHSLHYHFLNYSD